MAFAVKLINISAAILLPASCSSTALRRSLNLVSLLAISSAIVSHVRKTMTSPRERKWWWWCCWCCCWWRTAFNMVFLLAPPSSPSLPHPLHTHVSVAKFKQLLPANAFNGKTSFVAPNGAVAKVSFCLVSFRFCFGYFLSLLFASSNIHWVWVKGRCRGWGWGRGCCWCRHAAISLADSAPSPGQLHCHSHTESRPCRAYGARSRARSSSHLNAHIISNLCS